MRDIFIEEIYKRMEHNKRIFLLSGDFGAPAIDEIKKRFKDRFINVGIAEQNLVNVSTGLALEGFIIYAYAISPFLAMRPYEQIRVNLSLLSQTKEININLIGVGAGLSYDISGPTHHCLEDISIMRVLPNFILFSPSDWVLVKKFVDFSISVKKPKYARLDGKPLPQIYKEEDNINFDKGFYELIKGEEVCIVSTGYMTHAALRAASKLLEDNIRVGVIDIFLIKPLNENLLFKFLNNYKAIVTIEEAFINKGGLDSVIANVLHGNDSKIKLRKLGFKEHHVFGAGERGFLHKLHLLDDENIIETIKELMDNNYRR